MDAKVPSQAMKSRDGSCGIHSPLTVSGTERFGNSENSEGLAPSHRPRGFRPFHSESVEFSDAEWIMATCLGHPRNPVFPHSNLASIRHLIWRIRMHPESGLWPAQVYSGRGLCIMHDKRCKMSHLSMRVSTVSRQNKRRCNSVMS